jgi:hypothetical protein
MGALKMFTKSVMQEETAKQHFIDSIKPMLYEHHVCLNNREDQKIEEVLLSSGETPESMIRQYFESNDDFNSDICYYISKNPNIPTDIVERAVFNCVGIKHESHEFLASSKRLTKRAAEFLVSASCFNVMNILAKNEFLHDEVYEKLAMREYQIIKNTLVDNPKVPSSVLEYLYNINEGKNEMRWFVEKVLSHHNCPEDIVNIDMIKNEFSF